MDDRLDEIKKRRNLISNEGNWFIMHGEDLMGNCGYDEPDSLGWVKGEYNADFVSKAPTDIQWLIEEVERLQSGLNEIWNHTKGAPFDLYENKDRLLEVRAIVGSFMK